MGKHGLENWAVIGRIVGRRSADNGDLLVLRTRTVGFGPRNFAVVGQLIWNSLPSE